MKKTVTSQNYGAITYEESFWTANKQVYIDGQKLVKTSKSTFTYQRDGMNIPVTVKGHFKIGCTVTIGNESVVVYDKIKWYEILFMVLVICVPVVWGNVPALCEIFPVTGGILGAVIGVLMAYAGLIAMRATENVVVKILAFIGLFVANVVILFGVAMLLLTLAASLV